MTDKEKIIQCLKYKGVSKDEFYKKTGFSVGFLDSGSSLGVDKLRIIVDNYHDFNTEWLLTGKGEMLISDKTVTGLANYNTDEETGTIIPLYNAEASAGVGQLQLSNEYIIDSLQVPFARKEDVALTIVGDSMTPTMQNGDIAVVRNMPNWREYLDFGNIFVVVTENEVYCKMISKNPDGEIFTLKSYNTNYSEFEIPKKYVREVYKEIGIISQRCY